MKVLISGSSGLVGTHLVERLVEQEHEVVRLVRHTNAEGEIRWDPEKGPIDPKQLEGFDAVVHLGGVGIGEKRWSHKEKARIWDSRVIGTETLALSLSNLAFKPKVFVCASAVGYYGDCGEAELTEEAPQGKGFMALLCDEWEKSTIAAQRAGIRVVNLRSGIVFANDGGMLKKQLPLFKLCIAGRLGSGKQWMSWIDIDDEVNAIIHAINTPQLSGPINATSPDPVRNEDFTKLFATVLRRPAFIPAPAWMLELALGKQLTHEMLLASQRCVPVKLLETGFVFDHPDIYESLVRLYSPQDLNIFEEEDDEITSGETAPVIDMTSKRPQSHSPEQNGS